VAYVRREILKYDKNSSPVESKYLYLLKFKQKHSFWGEKNSKLDKSQLPSNIKIFKAEDFVALDGSKLSKSLNKIKGSSEKRIIEETEPVNKKSLFKEEDWMPKPKLSEPLVDSSYMYLQDQSEIIQLKDR
jgi:hypothetical protein